MSAKTPRRRPIYFRVAKMADPDTGEMVGCLVPRYGCDVRSMRDRRYTVGTEVRADLKKPRNAAFHRLAHAIGGLMVDQVQGFEGLDAHSAFKRLQRESGVCCEQQELDLGTLGKVVVNVARSISFDEMDEGEFQELVRAVYDTIVARYWPSMTPEPIARMVDMYEREAAGR